ncbi:MAG: bifunctional phosphopantothenoylcysteine decarboxylase/phosphopantothenate--cysteine ligase CoaBC [Actinomycetota bacterium]|nr:bifunctional phosphopantothenoylcysteine decarboxylase/phosphopantothenate--cysteine ligase CoaBC [Actinomycetota bacterium]
MTAEAPSPDPARAPVWEGFSGLKIVVCITGGIAAYKVVEVVRALVQSGAEVHVATTPSALRFVGEQTWAGISGRPVATQLFGKGAEAPHVELARGADLILVAPATANTLSRLAAGAADDIVAATFLMARCPLVVAPAMHSEMWDAAATRANVELLADRGVEILGPASGPLMSGDEGMGRMVEPAEIIESCRSVLAHARSLAGRRVLVTAGGTQEPIDAVRFLGNRSSGLMGIEIARAAQRRGAKVTLVMGPTGRPAPGGVDLTEVTTADEMRRAVLDLAGDVDVIVKAAAVADFKPDRAIDKKLKKADGPPSLSLIRTPDILAELGADSSLRRQGSVLVGFAAETENDPAKLRELALMKLQSKGADVIVANDVGSSDSGFGTRTNRAVVATRDDVKDLGLVTKTSLAEALVDVVAELLKRRRVG